MGKSAATEASGEKTAVAKKAAPPADVYVLDTTAGPDTYDQHQRPVSGDRIHEQIVNKQVVPFRFKMGIGTPMPFEIAAKFLQHEGFLLVDKDNKPIAYERPPKQADQLQAGEKIEIPPDHCIARLDELTNAALLKRVLVLPGGEKFANASAPGDRLRIIKFMLARKAEIAKANLSTKPDRAADEFVPDEFFGPSDTEGEGASEAA